ncbi:uncharacterized protein LOC125544354 isoform X2 [Triticum urartu]|uniref:uncharacterized protein LOC125544354 isoform X2 n=1 Tax=Triticum urartu TaxID=4572 RepID=UPI002044A1C8|nr:uncharacterized protein LOC125544354 isoform X2 [Triticum urartu]
MPRPQPRSSSGRGDGDNGKAAARWNWNRRTGAEGLPRGIVQTSSDMFLRLLWDPATKHAIPKVPEADQRTRASWTTKAHGARKRRMEFVRHRHGGGGGRARTKEDKTSLFFQVSEQHQEEELKNDHQEAPPQQQIALLDSLAAPLANGEAPDEASSKAMRRDRAPVIV